VNVSMPHVLIPLADGFEDMEAVIVCDILRRADVQVTLAGLGAGPVRGARGIQILPDALLADVAQESFDLLVLPGGRLGSQRLGEDSRLLDLLRERHERGEMIAAICAAPGVLAAQGLLEGRAVTAYPGTLDPHSPHYHYQETAVVVDGPLVTSRGPGTAMDFALTLVELLLGPAQRAQVEAPLQRSHVS